MQHNPATWGKPHNQFIYYGEIPASGDASGYAQNMSSDATGINWQGGNQGIGQYTLRQEQVIMQQPQPGGRVHLVTAGIVSGAILLLLIIGVVFQGSLAF